MTTLVYDTEGDNLLPDITNMWCICTLDFNTQEERQFGPESLNEGITFLFSAETIICHNQIGYDLPVIEKLFGRSYEGEVIDTIVLSRLLNPDRVWRHSLEGWAKHQGHRQKVENKDWSVFTAHMLKRCVEDVRINYEVYLELLEEMRA